MIQLKNIKFGKILMISGLITTLIITGIALWQGKKVESIAESETRQLAVDGQEKILAGRSFTGRRPQMPPTRST